MSGSSHKITFGYRQIKCLMSEAIKIPSLRRVHAYRPSLYRSVVYSCCALGLGHARNRNLGHILQVWLPRRRTNAVLML